MGFGKRPRLPWWALGRHVCPAGQGCSLCLGTGPGGGGCQGLAAACTTATTGSQAEGELGGRGGSPLRQAPWELGGQQAEQEVPGRGLGTPGMCLPPWVSGPTEASGPVEQPL